MQRPVQLRQGVCERRWGDVIGGSEPAISQASDPAQSRLRSPAANPNRHARLLSRKGFEWYGGQRRDTIEPGTGEGEMIVGAQGGEAKLLRRLSIVNQA